MPSSLSGGSESLLRMGEKANIPMLSVIGLRLHMQFSVLSTVSQDYPHPYTFQGIGLDL